MPHTSKPQHAPEHRAPRAGSLIEAQRMIDGREQRIIEQSQQAIRDQAELARLRSENERLRSALLAIRDASPTINHAPALRATAAAALAAKVTP